MSEEREQDAERITQDARGRLKDVLDAVLPKDGRDRYFAYGTIEQAIKALDVVRGTIDRLTAERDQAREQLAKLRSVIWSAYADLHSHLFTTVPVDAPNKMVEAYETLKAAYELSRAALESEAGE